MTEPIPPELRALIAAESKRVPSAALRVAVRARLASAVAAATAGVGALKLVLMIVLAAGSVGLATELVRALHADDPAPTLAVATDIARTEPSTAIAHLELEPAVADEPAPRAQPAIPRMSRVASVRPARGEAALLVSAYRALAVGDAARTLELVDEAARSPVPKLAEEC
jgi:hypothetical protein